MFNLKKRLKENKGFTLAELLIVVAIIAVLVAVSIPIFTSQLEKARESTDLANIRAAYAEGQAALLSDDYEVSTTKWYDTSSGTLADTKVACIKGTAVDGGNDGTKIGTFTYSGTTAIKDDGIKLVIDPTTDTLTITLE